MAAGGTCGKIVYAEDGQRLYFFITAHENREH